MLPDMTRHRTPLSEWVHTVLREPARRVVRDDAQYTRMFDKLEVLLSLAAAQANPWGTGYFAPSGCFFWRGDARDHFVTEIAESLKLHQDASPFVRCELFGKDAAGCQKGIDDLMNYVSGFGWDLRMRFRAR